MGDRDTGDTPNSFLCSAAPAAPSPCGAPGDTPGDIPVSPSPCPLTHPIRCHPVPRAGGTATVNEGANEATGGVPAPGRPRCIRAGWAQAPARVTSGSVLPMGKFTGGTRAPIQDTVPGAGCGPPRPVLQSPPQPPPKLRWPHACPKMSGSARTGQPHASIAAGRGPPAAAFTFPPWSSWGAEPPCTPAASSKPHCMHVISSKPCCTLTASSKPRCMHVTCSKPYCTLGASSELHCSKPCCILAASSKPCCMHVISSKPCCTLTASSKPCCMHVTCSNPCCALTACTKPHCTLAASSKPCSCCAR
uniref:Uncharacterized protein n=1 Tax=Anas platyrhynchos platyrhynchos TaxID=8840 RepID=A0A493SZH9_ANAPP